MSAPAVVFLAPEYGDVSVQRRCVGLQRVTSRLSVFTFFRKQPPVAPGVDFIVLAELRNARLVTRPIAFATALRKIWRNRRRIEQADVLYCRNLDIAMLGLLVRKLIPNRAVFVYEVLDIHPLYTRPSLLRGFARWLERRVLASCDVLALSSDGFARGYFRTSQAYRGPHVVIENKLPTEARALRERRHGLPEGPVVIGYFGKLRCAESMRMLARLAGKFPEIRIRMGGTVEPVAQSAFDALVALDNVDFFGPYAYPDDLSELYRGVALNWCFDFSDPLNSHLLLPNRIYEGGAFGVPALVDECDESGRVVRERGLGYILSGDVEQALTDLLAELDRETYAAHCAAIASAPDSYFFESDDHYKLLASVLEVSPHVPSLDPPAP